MGYQILVKKNNSLLEGETVFLGRGVAHKFWNAGDDELQMDNGRNPPTASYFFFLHYINPN